MHLHAVPGENRGYVPENSLIYAVGDIHGRADLLDRLLTIIAAHAAKAKATERKVVFLGDYIDRGPASPAVLDRLIAGPPDGFAWITLAGNHEAAFLDFLTGGSGATWLEVGGRDTVRAYLGEHAALPHRPEDSLRRELAARLPPAHLEFLKRLDTSHQEGGYFFAHAGVRPGVALDRQDPQDLLWIRRDFLSSGYDHGKVVVHGHSGAPEPQVWPNRIGIDTHAWISNRLTALVLQGGQRRFLHT